MTNLARAVEDYVSLRRSLGFKLERHPRLLADFIAFAEAAGATTVTVTLAVAWATQPAERDPVWWSQRLGIVRGFASYLRAFDPDTEVPPTHLLPRRSYRPEPYIYLPEEVTALMAAARAMTNPLRAATFETLIGLIASSGLRPGEALRFERDDLDWSQCLIDIRNTKFNKHRQVPLHSSTVAALAAYAKIRDQICPCPSSATFFVSTIGTRLVHTSADNTFARIATRAGLPRPGTARPPRLHDLRHFLAVSTVASWYRAGLDVNTHLPLLSTYLGHADPANSYWYLSATPELLALAAGRRDQFRGGRP
jgi:integrase/recombinase XerD